MTVTKTHNGFTFIELLIAMAIASIIMAAMYSVFEAQVRGQISQDVSLDMQQQARAAMEIMASEIRMAGCDPTQGADAGILTATATELSFSMDIRGDAIGDPPDGNTDDPNEIVRYGFGTTAADADDIVRQTPAGIASIAQNVDALNFVYFTEDENEDRAMDRMAVPVAAADLDEIRAIEVTFVIRSGEQVRGLLRPYTDSTDYENQQGEVILAAPNDTFRRLRLTTTVDSRNLN